MEQKREIIKQYIKQHIRESDLKRALHNSPDDWNFTKIYRDYSNIDGFYLYNVDKVNKSDDEFIDWVFLFMSMILMRPNTPKVKIFNMDKETMVPYVTDGFCWNAKGQFVIFNNK